MKKEMLLRILPIFIIILFIIAIFYFSYEYDCGDNKACYDRHLQNCKKTSLSVVDEGSSFTYQILGSEKDMCKLRVTLVDMPQETTIETAQLFEGKAMECQIPKGSTFDTEILEYCSGPLKEAIYELTIQKMYNILAQSLGDIIDKL